MGKVTMISVVYAVHNEEAIFARSLESVYTWVDEIIVVDGESTDNTVAIAKNYGAKVIPTTNKANFHINKQMAIDAAAGDLILQLDADEVVDTQLSNFVQKINQEHPTDCVAWQLKRRNLFLHRWLQKGGQYPDMVTRLFYADQAYLPQKDVHEQMVVKGKLGTASGHLLHFANPDLAAYFRKFNTYTSFKAQQLADIDLTISFGNFVKYCFWKPFITFWSIWLRHRGYVDGLAGFLFATFSGWHHLVAYCKYVEMQKPEPDGKVRVFYPGNEVETKAARGVGRAAGWLIRTTSQRDKVQIVTRRADADVIHYPFFDLYKKTLATVKKDQKLVVTVHDLIPLLFPNDFPAGIRVKFTLHGQKRRLRRADMIVTDSNATRQDVIDKFKINPEKVQTVYLAPNPNLHPATDSEVTAIKKSYALPEKYLLYVGDINFNKNLPQLIKALKFLPTDIHLVLCGKNFLPSNIPEWIVIQEQIDLSEVKSRVKFLTSITSDNELAALYTGSLAYVQPSSYEGFGLPVLEAMRCQTLVVAHQNSSLPEIGGDHVIWSDSLRGEDFAAAVQKVLKLSPSNRQKRLAAAYAWQENFTWEKTSDTMVSIYEKLAGEK